MANRKHSVFGRVIQGMEVLREMKKVPTDKKDRPVHEIIIASVDVLVNPTIEAEELKKLRLEKALSDRMAEQASREASALGKKRQAGPTLRRRHPSLRLLRLANIFPNRCDQFRPPRMTAST